MNDTTLLEGNGVALLKERAVAAAVQDALERLYHLERVAEVGAFVAPAGDGEREQLLVRTSQDGAIEMSLRVPKLRDMDALCQLIEGVSHFVYLAERARVDREATQLEMELQAEVDKYVVLAAWLGDFDPDASRALRERLYDLVSFSESDAEERYRVANDHARRYVWRLEQEYVAKKRYAELHAELRRFYRLGQEDKLRVGRAA